MKTKKERKHKHYWEHVPAIRKVLLEDGIDCSLNHIHRKTGISKGTLSYIFRIISREQILKSPEEAQKLLKTYQKGGDRLSREQKESLRQRQKEKWEKYLERFLMEAIQKREKSLEDNEKRSPHVREEGFTTLKPVSVQIGSVSITPKERRGVGGDSPSLRPGNENGIEGVYSRKDAERKKDGRNARYRQDSQKEVRKCSAKPRKKDWSETSPFERTKD